MMRNVTPAGETTTDRSARFIVSPGEIHGFALAVKFVADNRGANGDAMDPNLMGSAGSGLQRYQGILPG